MSQDLVPWAPRWSQIPPTVRGNSEAPLEMWVRSCLFRAHDCLHQLWGLSVPGPEFSKQDFYVYKRSQMCGEMIVLTLTEFVLAKHMWNMHPEIRPILWSRDALAMLRGPLRGRSTLQIAARLDGVLHKGVRPDWLRNHPPSVSFADYYMPMLEHDRTCIDWNWSLMKRANWRPVGAPNARYSTHTDGLELTTWMAEDFLHLLDTDPVVDVALACFNQSRRVGIRLPDGWNAPG